MKSSVKNIVDNSINEWSPNNSKREENFENIIQRSRKYQYDKDF